MVEDQVYQRLRLRRPLAGEVRGQVNRGPYLLLIIGGQWNQTILTGNYLFFKKI